MGKLRLGRGTAFGGKMGLKPRQLPGASGCSQSEGGGDWPPSRGWGPLSPSQSGLPGDWVWAEGPCRCRLAWLGQRSYRARNRQKLKNEWRCRADTQMASRCVNICSTSLTTRETPVKATSPIAPVEMVKRRRREIINAGENVEIGDPVHC